jgi:kynurenine formamidase
MEYLHPAGQKGRDEFCRYLGCHHGDLVDGEGWGNEVLTDLSSHCGTHIDAPLHSGSRMAGAPARTITDIALDGLYRPGLVLDVRPWAKSAEEITVEMLDAALAATGCRIDAGNAVLIRTGQERYSMTDPEYYMQPGMSRASTLHLTNQGAIS